MNFIFMLTHHDQTVADCLEAWAEVADLGLGHVGFKDVGVDLATLKRLTGAIRSTGAIAYIEVVSTSAQAIRRSIETAAYLGVERVLGGQDAAFALPALKEAGAGYYPFVGRPFDHPTRLAGSPGDIERDCRAMRAIGCPGVDLLAYRATEADPLELIRAARRGLGLDGTLIVAGGIDSPARIAAVKAAGADAFTIGSAIFAGSFAPGAAGLRGQCPAVLDVLKS